MMNFHNEKLTPIKLPSVLLVIAQEQNKLYSIWGFL